MLIVNCIYGSDYTCQGVSVLTMAFAIAISLRAIVMIMSLCGSVAQNFLTPKFPFP